MSLTCHSHMKECSVRNALLWGMCRSHFNQAYIQNRLQDKIIHLALAIIEVIPVIGQIISLIELKVVLKNSRPQQISCVPSIRLITHQETPEDLCRIWPEDLAFLSLNQDQKQSLDQHLRDAFRSGEFQFSKKKLIYVKDSSPVHADLPLSIAVGMAEATPTVFLFPKTVFAVGGERKIRWAYNLTEGQFLIKKRIVGVFEKSILQIMHAGRKKRGIETPVFWRSSMGKLKVAKQQMVEPIRDGILSNLFGKEPLSNFVTKQALIKDLLHDLVCLHKVNLSNVKITTASGHQIGLKTFVAFHSDLKVSNILVFLHNGKWRAEICDFGQSSSNPASLNISIGWTPPEYIRSFDSHKPFGFDSSFNKQEEYFNFNAQHGAGRDIWSMGLVILTLLVEREEEACWVNLLKIEKKACKIPPLPSLKSCLEGDIWSYYDEKNVLKLTQEDIYNDLNRLQGEVLSKHPEKNAFIARLFNFLKQMLKIDPNERMKLEGLENFLLFLEGPAEAD